MENTSKTTSPTSGKGAIQNNRTSASLPRRGGGPLARLARDCKRKAQKIRKQLDKELKEAVSEPIATRIMETFYNKQILALEEANEEAEQAEREMERLEEADDASNEPATSSVAKCDGPKEDKKGALKPEHTEVKAEQPSINYEHTDSTDPAIWRVVPGVMRWLKSEEDLENERLASIA